MTLAHLDVDDLNPIFKCFSDASVAPNGQDCELVRDGTHSAWCTLSR